jgi:hypothetical protein
MPPRRSRTVAPDDVLLPADEPQDTVPAAFAASTPAKRAARRVQAATADPKVRIPEGERAAEIADGVLTAPIAGRSFRLSETIGLMPLMEWAAASDEVDVSNAGTLITFYRLLKDLVHEDDWAAFRSYTREQKCDDNELLAFQNAAMEALAARPTAAPAAS